MATENAKTYYLARKILNHALGVEHFTFPTQVFLALFPEDPGDSMLDSVELNKAGYSRVRIIFASANVTGSIASNVLCEFSMALEDWGAIAGWAIFDAQTGGSALYHGSFEKSRMVFQDDAVRIKPGELTITEY